MTPSASSAFKRSFAATNNCSWSAKDRLNALRTKLSQSGDDEVAWMLLGRVAIMLNELIHSTSKPPFYKHFVQY